MKQARPELILLGLAILLNEAVQLKRLEQAMDRGARDVQPVRQLADAEPARSTGEGAKDPRRAIDRLDRSRWSCPASAPRVSDSVMVGFGIVEWPSMM